MNTSLSKSHNQLQLTFMPEEYKGKFVEAILEHYHSSGEMIGPGGIVNQQPFPEVTNDLAFGMVEYFLIGCLYQETNNPYELSNIIENVQNRGEDIADIYEELFDEYASPGFGTPNYSDEFIDDITGVLDYYNMSYTFVWTQPISGTTYYSYEHAPTISVW